MKNQSRLITIGLILSFFIFISWFSYGEEIVKTFKPKKSISIKTVSGNCIIKKGSSEEIKVRVVYTYSKDCYEPEFDESDNVLHLSEDFKENHCSGKSTWYLDIPEKTDIKFSTASGDLNASDLKGELTANTASGDVELLNVSGEIEVSTASGDVTAEGFNKGSVKTASGDVMVKNSSGNLNISTASGNIRVNNLKDKINCKSASGKINIQNSSGEFNVSAASGDIEAGDVVILNKSSFSAASGDVSVVLSRSLEHDLKLSTASGDSKLNFNGNTINGYFEFSAREDRGGIFAPFKFDKEETYESGDQTYVRKSFTKGSGQPIIKISTASGKASLIEK